MCVREKKSRKDNEIKNSFSTRVHSYSKWLIIIFIRWLPPCKTVSISSTIKPADWYFSIYECTLLSLSLSSDWLLLLYNSFFFLSFFFSLPVHNCVVSSSYVHLFFSYSTALYIYINSVDDYYHHYH
jgi:hypothetical protein